MNPQQQVIYQKALVSNNPEAVIKVAWALHELGEPESAYVLLQRISATFGIDVPPVPIPEGYRRATAKEITKPVLTFARKALQHALPIGKQQITVVTNPDKSKRTIMALTEHHLDNHPARPKQGYGAGEGPVFLHPGISMLVPIHDTVAGFAGFGVDAKAGGMSVEHEDAYRKALWAQEGLAVEGGILALSALALLLFRKQLGFVH